MEQKILRQRLSDCSYSSNEVSRLLEERTGKRLRTKSVKRWAKRLGFRRKRTRKSLSSKRNSEEFKQAHQDLKACRELEKQGQAQEFFVDATGLPLTPFLPYGWYPTGQEPCVSLSASHSKRLNIIGFLSRQPELVPFIFEGSCPATMVKSSFDSFCAQLEPTVPTIVVMHPCRPPNYFRRVFPIGRPIMSFHSFCQVILQNSI